MNPPPTPPEEGSQCRGTLDEFPSWGARGGSVHGKGGLPKTALDWAHEPESIAIGRSGAQHGRCELWCLCARWKDWLWCAACKLFGDTHEVFPLGSFAFFLSARQARCFFP